MEEVTGDEVPTYIVMPTLMWMYQFIIGVLLVNLLIAQMAKTFDSVKEASEMNYLFLFAQTVCSVAKQPPAPLATDVVLGGGGQWQLLFGTPFYSTTLQNHPNLNS